MTVRKLYILRHAKAEASGRNGHDDHARELVKRGIIDAEALGRQMANEGDVPTRAICSTATRARQTLEALMTGLDASPSAEHTRKLYMATPGEIFRVIHAEGRDSASLIIVGHNPGVHLFCQTLDDRTNPVRSGELAGSFPTCTLAVFETKQAWADLEPGSGRLVALKTRGNS